jgi:hypothetical protein
VAEDCGNGTDDDVDGDIDCADADCVDDLACSAWTCGEVLTCAQACGPNIGCLNSCAGNACNSAQDAWDAVQSCTLSNCLGACLDPSALQCQTCVQTSCFSDLAVCVSNSCP